MFDFHLKTAKVAKFRDKSYKHREQGSILSHKLGPGGIPLTK